MSSPYLFITVEELRVYPLPVKEAQWDKITDDQIEVVIGYATENVQDYLDRSIFSGTYTERIPGSGKNLLILSEYPVNTIYSIESHDSTDTVLEYDPDDLILNEGAGLIKWANAALTSFWRGFDWVISYTAGYSTIPGPIKHATALQTIAMLQPLFRGGTNFVQVDLVNDSNEMIVDLLERYKR